MFLNFKRLALTAIFALFLSCHAFPNGNSVDHASNVSSRDIDKAATKLLELGVPLQKDPKGDIRWIEAKKGELRDESIPYLPHLPKLEWLEIGKGRITANGLERLGKCTTLKRLYIFSRNPLSMLS